jgi:hypothetical protein
MQLYTRLSLEVKTRMEEDLSTECFAARLWDQQAKMNLTTEELSYSEHNACVFIQHII